jgi:hypothetical protein
MMLTCYNLYSTDTPTPKPAQALFKMWQIMTYHIHQMLKEDDVHIPGGELRLCKYIIMLPGVLRLCKYIIMSNK